MSTTDESNIPVMKVRFTDNFANDVMDEQAKRLEKLSKQDAYAVEIDGKVKTFKRRKILTHERAKIQALRNKLVRVSVKDNSAVEEELYVTMCSLYLIDTETNLPMTKEQYMNIPYEDIRDILEACSFRTEKPIPRPLETKTS